MPSTHEQKRASRPGTRPRVSVRGSPSDRVRSAALSVPFVFRPRVFEWAEAPSVPRLLSALRARRRVVALDSAGGEPRRFSLVAFDPVRVLEARRFDAPELRALVGELAVAPGDAVPGPFAGGFVGAIAYDVGVHGERPVAARPEPWGLARALGGLYVDFVVRDEQADRAWLVLGDEPGDARPPVDERRRSIERALRAAEPDLGRFETRGPLVRDASPGEHEARVERCRERIAAGDVYQANLAHRSTQRVRGDPLALYARLRAVNPSPYMAFLDARDAERPCALLSASPELFVEVDGRVARTRPIKGTIARGATAEEDAERRAALLSSAKDLAELTMIVDLERNDLGRIARAGGVSVERFPHLATYPGLHHLMGDVVADVRADRDAVDVFAALFPGGSITGAPKLAAMDLIAELEGVERGFFTGSLGFVDVRGRMAFNILIRTLTWRPADRRGAASDEGEVAFHVGGGITWSSDPAAEERETLVKAERLVRALAGTEVATGGAS